MKERVFVTEISLNQDHPQALGNVLGSAYLTTQDLYERKLNLTSAFPKDRRWGMLCVVSPDLKSRRDETRLDVLVAADSKIALAGDLAFFPDSEKGLFDYSGDTVESHPSFSVRIGARIKESGGDWWYDFQDKVSNLMVVENCMTANYGFRVSAEELGKTFRLAEDPEPRRQRFTVVEMGSSLAG